MSAPRALRIERGPRTGQPIIISLDSTELGPALGGCRVKPYASWRDGMDDALRLSAAMTAKAALAEMPYGGGKAVVALSPGTAALYAGARRGDLLADVGEAVESFDGSYITGPDVGTSPDDMAVIGRRTRHVLCRPQGAGGSGDSSAPTAAGVLASIDAVRDRVFDGRPASRLTFAIQGLGHVGILIVDALARQGASLVVADTEPDRQRLATRWRARVAAPEQMLTSEADILVPAALGATLTPQAVPALRCRAIVGPANNQLADDSVADLLHAHGITWAPDPVVSAGGIVASVAREISHLTEPEVQNLLAAIGDRLGALLDESARSGQPPLTVARQRLRRRLTQDQASAGLHPAVATAPQPCPPPCDRLSRPSTVLTAAHRGQDPQPSKLTKSKEGAPVTENPSFDWIEVTIDCMDVKAVSEFWCHLLGVNRVDDPLLGWARAAATVPSGPVLNFQPVPDPKVGKSRVHLDLRTDDLPAAMRRVGALGGACTGEVHVYKEGTVAVMTDPEGTEFCLTGPPGSATEC